MFTLNEAELLSSHLPHARFTELVNQHATEIHEIKLSTNLYGEWLFVTLSAHIPQLMWNEPTHIERRWVTFWGLGFHESRELWECDHWRWHEAQSFRDAPTAIRLAKQRAWSTINERRAFCLAKAKSAQRPSAHASAFAFFADMGDEDGATTLLEDMAAMGIDIEDIFDE
jgi:hypothetical protein